MKDILFLTTGGTVAAAETESGLVPQKSPAALLRYIPELSAICRVTALEICNLDSTDMTPSVWLKLISCLEENYARYDGFVITHGTDTLSYTAAALSYCIQNSEKPIVLTGSQLPIDAAHSDASENLKNAFLVANSDLAGVSVVFGGRVIAGTRAKKMYTKRGAAFESVNFPYRAEVQNGEIQKNLQMTVDAIPSKCAPVVYHALNPRVAVFYCTPGVSPQSLQAVADICDALVLETYGLGGIPAYLYSTVENILSSGKVLAVGTEVPFEGTDMSIYRVGRRAKEQLPIVELGDMTTEAATVKLMWALAQTNRAEEVRHLFCLPIAFDRRA